MPRTRNGAINGHAVLRRMPVRTARVQLEGDYADFSLVMRSNPPMRVFTDMQANNDFAALSATLRSLIIDWDFVDEQGEALSVGNLEACSIELFGMIITRYLATVADAAQVPKA